MRPSLALVALLLAGCLLTVAQCHDGPHPKSLVRLGARGGLGGNSGAARAPPHAGAGAHAPPPAHRHQAPCCPAPARQFPLAHLRVLLEERITLAPSVRELTANEQPVVVRIEGVSSPGPSDLVTGGTRRWVAGAAAPAARGPCVTPAAWQPRPRACPPATIHHPATLSPPATRCPRASDRAIRAAVCRPHARGAHGLGHYCRVQPRVCEDGQRQCHVRGLAQGWALGSCAACLAPSRPGLVCTAGCRPALRAPALQPPRSDLPRVHPPRPALRRPQDACHQSPCRRGVPPGQEWQHTPLDAACCGGGRVTGRAQRGQGPARAGAPGA